MPPVLKFHLDEHVSPAIAAGLRRRDIDVTTTREVGLQGADDSDHIAFALSAGRVIVTHDDDFLMLHAQGVRHAGIAYVIPRVERATRQGPIPRTGTFPHHFKDLQSRESCSQTGYTRGESAPGATS